MSSAQSTENTHLRKRLREAIRILVTEGTTQREAAERAGMTEHGLQRALSKPHVRAWRDGMARAHLEGKTPVAWKVVHSLMEGAASEDVQLKAARTHLSAFGELDEDGRRSEAKPFQVIQIITSPAYREVPPPEVVNGVIEAPPLFVVSRRGDAA
jgi:predicted DNA-binding protein (UPF0251 family)